MTERGTTTGRRPGRSGAGARATAIGLATVAAIAAAGAAPGAVRGQDVREVTLRAEPAAWIGVSIEVAVGADGSLVRPDGLLVTRVMEESPAGRAGLRPGDRIVRVNGRVATVERFKTVAGGLEPGDRIVLGIEGDGYEKQVTITASARPDSPVHFLPREMIVRISSKVDSLRFYAVQATAPGTTATGSVAMTVDAARIGDVARAIAGDADAPREPVRVLLGSEDSTTWFEGAELALDSTYGHFFGVRVDRAERPLPLTGAYRSDDALDTGTSPGSTLRLRGVRSAGSAGRPPEGAPSVFTLVEQRDLVAGARLTRVGADLATYFDVEGGLLVTEVIDGTPSTEAGLRPGDVLVEVDERPLEEIEQFRRAWASAAHENRTLTLTLVRRGERMELRLPR